MFTGGGTEGMLKNESYYHRLTCQLMRTYLVRCVFSSVMPTNAYNTLPLFHSSANSFKPPSPVPTTLNVFEWPSYPYNALQTNPENPATLFIYFFHSTNINLSNHHSPIDVIFRIQHVLPYINNIIPIRIQINRHSSSNLFTIIAFAKTTPPNTQKKTIWMPRIFGTNNKLKKNKRQYGLV